MQLGLFSDNGVNVSLVEVPISDCVHNRFNTRKTRNSERIKDLAQRITTNGFEKTRAPWAVRVNGHYEIFAGGTRFEAAKIAGLTQIPLMLHDGLSEEEISRRADVDNENDEYHEPVSIVDIWAEYARLRDEEGWTQERIGEVKGVSQKTVSIRLNLHRLSENIKSFIPQGLLTEAHLREISEIYLEVYFEPWLASERAQLELATWAAGGKTVRETKAKVDKWQAFIDYAKNVYEELSSETELYSFDEDPPSPYVFNAQERFVTALRDREARSLTQVKAAEREMRLLISDNLNTYQQYIELKTTEAALAAQRAKAEEELLKNLVLGDFRDKMTELPSDSVDLIFTDPPYADENVSDYGDLAKEAARVLKTNGSLIVYAGHHALPEIFKAMCPHLRYWWQIIVKHSGASARLPGKWVFVEYKPLLWFVKGGRRDKRYFSDFIHSKQPTKESHEWEQDLSEAKYCIEQLTDEDDLIVDPFCGSGTTAIAALETKRRFWICDDDQESFNAAQDKLLRWLDGQSRQSNSQEPGKGSQGLS